MEPENIKNKAILKKPSLIANIIDEAKSEFHFAGSGQWHPITILAEDIHKAIAEWEKVRKPVKPSVDGEGEIIKS